MDRFRRLAAQLIGTAAVFVFSCFARAEPILLAQLYHAHSQPDTAGEMFNFRFHTAASSLLQAEISRKPTTADIGQTFAADPATVSNFDRILTDPSFPRIVDSGLGIAPLPREALVQEFFDGPFMDDFPSMPIPESFQFIMKAFVPQLGPNFSGYHIRAVHQTIEGMTIRQVNPTTFLYWGAQTIRIFGEQIPEPATWLITVTCTILCLLPRTNALRITIIRVSRN
jgi:hypothetical protein